MTPPSVTVGKWRLYRLSDICEKITQGPNPKYDKSGDPKFRVLKTKDLYDDCIHYETADQVSEAVFSAHLKAELQAGDLLLAIVGQGSINKCNVYEGRAGARYIFTRALGLLRPKLELVDPHFLKFFLQSEAGKRMIDAGIGGTSGQQVVTTTHLKSLQICLPPLVEQKRIVTVLEQAFAVLDRARTHAKANLTDVEELFRLERELSLDGNGKDWRQTTVGEICDRFEYGTSAKSLSAGQVPVLRMGNLQGGALDWTDLVFTNSDDDIKKLNLKTGDVLFNRTNSAEHVGKAAIYRGEKPAIFAGYLIRLHRKADIVDGEFLNIFLNSDRARDYGRSVMGKSVNQANISASKLKTYPISLPGIGEQRRIAQNLRDLSERVDNLSKCYEAKLADIVGLRQSLLRKAFAGELT